jgi:outer membrane protein OmpA-like peptidoglycan-associated protein
VGQEWITSLELSPLHKGCGLTVVVLDQSGSPLAAKIRAVGEGPAPTSTSPATGAAQMELLPGDALELMVTAPGLSPDHIAVACKADETGQLSNIRREVLLQAPRARLAGGYIEIDDKIQFQTDSDIIDFRSKGILDDVARVMSTHPEILLLEVQGHTDARGSEVHNLDLSKRRAISVARYLQRAGVDAARLRPIGLGETNPRDTSDTEVAHEANRRVEFVVKQVAEEDQ